MAMLGVCLCHTLFIGVGHRCFGVSELLGGFAGGAVDCFVFISGWYGIRFSWKKLLSLYSTALFCAVECRIGMDLYGLGWGTVIAAIKDIAGGYWFLHAYAALMCIAPLIESAMGDGDKKVVLNRVSPFLLFVFAWGWLYTRLAIWEIPFPHVHGQESHSWVTLVGVYVVARLCRIYEVDRRLSMWMCVVGALLFSAVAGLHYGLLGGYNSIAAIAMTTCLFCMFKKIPMEVSFVSRACSVVVPSLFAIYLIHQSPIGRMLVSDVGGIRHKLLLPDVIAGVAFATLVFVCSFVADIPRRLIVLGFRRLTSKVMAS